MTHEQIVEPAFNCTDVIDIFHWRTIFVLRVHHTKSSTSHGYKFSTAGRIRRSIIYRPGRKWCCCCCLSVSVSRISRYFSFFCSPFLFLSYLSFFLFWFLLWNELRRKRMHVRSIMADTMGRKGRSCSFRWYIFGIYCCKRRRRLTGFHKCRFDRGQRILNTPLCIWRHLQKKSKFPQGHNL